ncbi:hypothetical protein OIU93_16000 [Paeniglutamicibacter sp. ZC-3]|nr:MULTISPECIES: hypothetical protein [Paeniglutamicibacter]MCV9995790.1 hypothetical protein [Paeniglutamicibacter sp. ZC-3]MDO2934254.1 hypothetical protein [Paeniglutamicibacter sulfureus]
MVQILDKHSSLVCTCPRAFGKHTETIFVPASLVLMLVIKPGN